MSYRKQMALESELKESVAAITDDEAVADRLFKAITEYIEYFREDIVDRINNTGSYYD